MAYSGGVVTRVAWSDGGGHPDRPTDVVHQVEEDTEGVSGLLHATSSPRELLPRFGAET